MADRLLDAMACAAARGYGGEAVSELEHALQCAELARDAGADDELQLACLLHDVGRYAVDQSLVSDATEPTRAGPGARGHHEVGAELIAPWVPERVAWCVRMHADAKRYLCATATSAGCPRSRGTRCGSRAGSWRPRRSRGSPGIRGSPPRSPSGAGTTTRRWSAKPPAPSARGRR